MAFVSTDLMVNVLYGMAGGAGDPGCTPSPTLGDDEGEEGGCTPSPTQPDCTPSPPEPEPDEGYAPPCTPTQCTPSPVQPVVCTPSPGQGGGKLGDKDHHPQKALASLRRQLRETLAQA
jgi:hypothetical protein